MKSLIIIIGAIMLLQLGGKSVQGLYHVVDNLKGIYIVDINARINSEKNPVSMKLPKGVYTIKVIGVADGGAYDAWKPWFYKPKMNDEGEWNKGWVNKYSFRSSEFSDVTCTDGEIYPSPALALENGQDSEFRLSNNTMVGFYI